MTAKGNTHSITAGSELGTLTLSIANRPSPSNPKTSWIVARAVLAAMDQHFCIVQML